MSSRFRSRFKSVVGPIELAQAASVVAYLLFGAAEQKFGHVGDEARLLSLSGIVVAFVAIVVGYVVASLKYGPKIEDQIWLDYKSGKISRDDLHQVRMAAREAQMSKVSTWHFVIAVVGGSLFGLAVVQGIKWLLS